MSHHRYSIDQERLIFQNYSQSLGSLMEFQGQDSSDKVGSTASQNLLRQNQDSILGMQHPNPYYITLDQEDLARSQMQSDIISQTQFFAYIGPIQPQNNCSQNSSNQFRKKTISLNNRRRKLHERKILKKKFKRNDVKDQLNKEKRTGDQWTKNLLKVCKCSLSNFLKNCLQGQSILQQNPQLQELMKKPTFYLIDFNFLYQSQCLEKILSHYFEKRILYRDLMISRVTEKNKELYMYYLDIFEQNFKNREFFGISEPKQRIESRKERK